MTNLLHPPLPDAAAPHWRWLGCTAARARCRSPRRSPPTRGRGCSSPPTRANSSGLAVELRFFGGAGARDPDAARTGRSCRTISSRRIRTSSRSGCARSRACPQLRRGILLLTTDSLLARLPPVGLRAARAASRSQRGAALAIEPLRQRLVAAGYASVSQVSGPGEFALRGSLFDVWPMGTDAPVRIDLLDDRIDSLRRFDPETQRSLESDRAAAAAAGARAAARCRGGARVPPPLPAALRAAMSRA